MNRMGRPLLALSVVVAAAVLGTVASGAQPEFCTKNPNHWKCQSPPPPPPPPAPGAPIFSDEFNGAVGTKPDAARWWIWPGDQGCSTSINDSWTCSRPKNVFMDGQGNLVLRVSKATCANPSPTNLTCKPYDGGWIATWDRWTCWPCEGVLYTVAPPVRFEVRVKAPAGAGLWPGFWPENPYEPASEHLELDILELRMFQPTVSTCHVHYFRSGVYTVYGTQIETGRNLSADFHTYWAEYRQDRITFGVDELTCAMIVWPQPESRRVGLQFDNIVGPPDRWGGQGGPPPDSVLPADMLIDWVRVYQL